jgi:tetratricopeptide (TPR) repeat protein
MGRPSTFVLAVSTVVLGPVDLAHAGGTRAAPAVRVIAPSSATGLERDDLPAPQLEVIRHAPTVELPGIPAFARRSTGEQSRAPNELAIEIDLDVDAGPALRRFVDDVTLESSLGHLDTCNKALAARQYEAAIAACRAATDAWPDNHLAWYAQASAYLAKQHWTDARNAVENAVKLRPDRAMYQLYRGISVYEAEHQRAHRARPRGDRCEIAELAVAREALVAAIKLAPDLWRAHYYLGRVYRDLDDARRAAQQFTAAIRANPGYRLAYIALSELYRGSDHGDQALAVALLGTQQLPVTETAELWFEVGMAYDAGRAVDKPVDKVIDRAIEKAIERAIERAIDAFGHAIAIKPSDALSKLQRGQLYYATGDLEHARLDLADALRSADPRLESSKPLVTRLLGQIAQHQDDRSADSSRWDCWRHHDAIACRPHAR